jgi:hypothetical protein
MFDTVNFLAHVWPFVLLKKFVKYVKLYVYMKVSLVEKPSFVGRPISTIVPDAIKTGAKDDL